MKTTSGLPTGLGKRDRQISVRARIPSEREKHAK